MKNSVAENKPGRFKFEIWKVAESSSSELILLSSYPNISIPDLDQRTSHPESVHHLIFYPGGNWLKRLEPILILPLICSSLFINTTKPKLLEVIDESINHIDVSTTISVVNKMSFGVNYLIYKITSLIDLSIGPN